MEKTGALTAANVKKLVFQWFKKLDDHAPVEEILSLLSLPGIELHFIGVTVKGEREFREWYDTMIHRYFDEEHRLQSLDVEVTDDRASVTLIVNWQARTWESPAAFSKRLSMDVCQSWRVVLDRTAGKPVIAFGKVDSYEDRHITD